MCFTILDPTFLNNDKRDIQKFENFCITLRKVKLRVSDTSLHTTKEKRKGLQVQLVAKNAIFLTNK
jgi:hypothetical protein